jgi:hypothetical protein
MSSQSVAVAVAEITPVLVAVALVQPKHWPSPTHH